MAKVKDAKDRQTTNSNVGRGYRQGQLPSYAHTEHSNLETATKAKIATMSFCVSYNKD